jgi:hypothetical protein
MPSYYENLVAKVGEDKAREQMKAVRAQRRTNNGGGFNDPEVVKKAIEIRKGKKDEMELSDS